MAASKRLFEAVAAEFRDIGWDSESGERFHWPDMDAEWAVEYLAERLAVVFKGENSNFDRSRFLAACRGEDSIDSAGRKVRYAREPHCNHDAPAVRDGVCECGVRVA